MCLGRKQQTSATSFISACRHDLRVPGVPRRAPTLSALVCPYLRLCIQLAMRWELGGRSP